MSEPSSEARALLELPRHELEVALAKRVRAGEDSASLLLELELAAPDKSLRKLVRRALHRLRSAGVDLPPIARGSASPGGVLRPLEAAEEQGAVTPPDLTGRRLVFLLVPTRRGVELYEVAISDEEGLLGLRRHDLARRQGRAFLRSLRGGERARTLAVPGAEVRALIGCARALGTPADVDRSALAALAAPEGASTPGERLREKRGADSRALGTAAAEAALAERIDRRILVPWPLRGEAIVELARELARGERSPLVLSPMQRQDRRGEQLAQAAQTLYDAPARERFAARLEETAVFLDGDRDEAGALAALAVAARVRGPDPPLSVDFLRRSLDLSLELAGGDAEREDEGNLILPG